MATLTKKLCVCLAFGFAILANANTITVYKSIGPHGEVRYSQIPPRDSKNVEAIQFRGDGRINTPGDYAAAPIDPNQQAQQNQVTELNQKVQELEERENARRCQTLRNNLANYNIGGRIYEMDASGNKVYLNDQEIQARRDRTQQAIAQYCSGTGSIT